MENKNYIDPNIDSGRFAEPEELEADYTEVRYDEIKSGKINTAAGVGIEIRMDENGNVTGALVDGGDTNTIIVSATGSGKTRRVLCQYILSCIFALHSFIAHDPKGELVKFFSKLLKVFGYEVRVIDLRNPMRGDRLNFLEPAARTWKSGDQGRAYEMARQIAETIFSPVADADDMFWVLSSINLFLCYFAIAATIYEPEYVTLSAIYRIHIEGQENVSIGKTRLGAYLEEYKNEKVYELGITSLKAPGDTRASIYSVFSNGLARILLNEDIADMTTKSTFDIEDFASGEKPMALFIITRDEAPQTYSTVVSSIVDAIYTTLIDVAHTKYNDTLPNQVHFILEEFGNIAKLENINSMMTASRSRGIRMVIVLQSLCQLHLTYSRDLAEVLIGNSQNLVYMSSTDMNLVEMISRRCGTMVDPYTMDRRALLSPDGLTHLDKDAGETLMILNRHYPYVTHLPDLSCYKMIEQSEEVIIPRRKRLDLKYGVFAKFVEEISENKRKKRFEERAMISFEAWRNSRLEEKPSLSLPSQSRKIVDRILEKI